LIANYERHGFVRIHRNHAINPSRALEIRREKASRGWSVKLEPLQNRVLPVSRGRLSELWKAFGEVVD
jgi:DNA-binding LytR/AlgR family response regulator